MDVFRTFDALNDVRNLKRALDAVKRTGKHAQGTICYTISPVHSVDYFVSVAEELAALGVQIICLKDMGGLLRPYVAAEIVEKLKARIPLPVHLHSHCTAGLAPLTMPEMEAGWNWIADDVFFSEVLYGRAWRWDHKTVFSVLSWAAFALLLLGRLRFGWRGRKAVRVLYTFLVIHESDRGWFQSTRGCESAA